LLSVPEGARGLQQSEAVFQHVRRVPELMERMRASLPEGMAPVAICASVRPRPADESYMPVFQVGAGYARMAAALYRIPYYETSHQQGHVRAAQVGTGLPLEQPLLVFHLSGGTTELLHVEGGSVRVVCETGDLHAGQLVDRIGVALGLPFPAGPMLEELAVRGEAQARIPVSVRGNTCHLSGAERQLMDLAEKGTLSKQDLAAEVYSFLTRTIQRM
ncbi:MAG TPA: O-sialoglycoprotein endopeptidase, partial [Clostridia bacterium]|nr:O-sialoglycoprotein endopeptidase [Clostridia bacterium]